MKRIIIPLILCIILSSSVLGFGVTDWLEGPVKIAPGGTGNVVFELQNMVGQEDLVVHPDIIQGQDIASIKEGDNINVPLGVKKDVNAVIKIPEDYPEGNYLVEVSFVSESKGAEGPVKFGTGITKRFSVDVIKEGNGQTNANETPVTQEGKFSIATTLIILAIIVLIITIVRFIGKKKV